MAPGYRANNQSRRNNNRGYVDHDVFEGLPVRNWRRDTVHVAPPSNLDPSTKPQNRWDVELPWGMPKDSHLLPQHSQDLLRAARSGRLYKRRPAVEEDEVDPEAVLGEKLEKKEAEPKEEGFSVKTWKLIPKHQESPEIEYLAKRRKGLRGTAVVQAVLASYSKTTVRLTDADGNMYIQDVVINEGQAMDGELISQTAIADPALNPTGEALPIQPALIKRRPPPPKRKAKAPGRGRKRKMPVAPTSVPAGFVKLEGEPQENGLQEDAVGPDGIKIEQTETPSGNGDGEMGEDSILPSDDDGEEGDDGEDGDEGEDGASEDDHDGRDQDEVTDIQEPPPAAIERRGSTLPKQREPSSSPELPLSSAAHLLAGRLSHEFSGSPLKQVLTPPSGFDGFSPEHEDGDGDADAEEDMDHDSGMDMNGEENMHSDHLGSQDHFSHGMDEHDHHDELDQTYHISDNIDADTHFHSFHHSDEPSAMHEGMPEEVDDMLLDDDMFNGPRTDFDGPDDDDLDISADQDQEHTFSHSMDDDVHDDELQDDTHGQEENFVDLLGSLEDHLNDNDQDHEPNQELDQLTADELPDMGADIAASPADEPGLETLEAPLSAVESAAPDAAVLDTEDMFEPEIVPVGELMGTELLAKLETEAEVEPVMGLEDPEVED